MNIFDEVDDNLFRPLTGTNKRKYVDILAIIWEINIIFINVIIIYQSFPRLRF